MSKPRFYIDNIVGSIGLSFDGGTIAPFPIDDRFGDLTHTAAMEWYMKGPYTLGVDSQKELELAFFTTYIDEDDVELLP